MQMSGPPWLWNPGQMLQKSTKWVSVAPQKGLMSSNFLLKNWSQWLNPLKGQRYPSSIQPLQSGTTFVVPNTSHQLNKFSRNMRLEVKHPMTICLNRHYPGGWLNRFRLSASWPHYVHGIKHIYFNGTIIHWFPNGKVCIVTLSIVLIFRIL